MKKLSTTKLHNFSRSTTFVLVVSPFQVILKIQMSNLKNLNIVFLDKMTSNKKLSTIKLFNFSRSITFILDISPSKVIYEMYAISETIIKILENLRMNIWGT
jgi:hypothetical protein